MAATYYEYLDALKKNARLITKVEWLNPDGSVAFDISGDAIQGGSLSVSYQNGIRRTADITIDNSRGAYDMNVNNMWFGQQIKLSVGIELRSGDMYYLPQGVFYINPPAFSYTPSGETVQLSLVDKWAYLDGTLFGKLEGIYQLNVDDNLFTAVEQILLKDRGNGYPIDNIVPMMSTYYKDKTITYNDKVIPILNCPYTSRFNMGSSYADIFSEICTMLVGEIGYDKTGRLRIDSVQTDVVDSQREIMWDFSTESSELINYSITPKVDAVYNDIIITGAVINGAIVKGRATNTNVKSPTSVQYIGYKTFSEEQSKYYSNEQCQELAEYKLRLSQALSESISITCIPLPHFTENQLITLQKPGDSYVRTPYLVQSYTLPLAQTGTMTITGTSVGTI